jgi:putative acetyltransferase
MFTITRTKSSNPTFKKLVKELDSYLAIVDGDDHAFYSQYNKLDSIKHVLLVYSGDTAIACGAIKEYNSDTVEVKRMFTLPSFRGKGVAQQLLTELEIWARELGYKKVQLETGVRQTEAVALYVKCKYSKIPNYGQYEGLADSICFGKTLSV